jgi:hypothetical protein
MQKRIEQIRLADRLTELANDVRLISLDTVLTRSLHRIALRYRKIQ